MNATLARVVHRTEIGLSIGEREVAACMMAITPLRRTEVVRAVVPYEPDGLVAAVKEAFAACSKRGDIAGARVTIGLSSLRLFFSTRSILAKNLDASPLTLLHELIQSSTLVVDDMAVDLIKPREAGQTLASIVSCRKKYLFAVLSALESCGVVPVRAEPSACALVRLASKRHKPPRKAPTLMRVFLGTTQGLAVLLTKSDLPLSWRPFELPEGGESAAILAAIASLRVIGRHCGLQSDLGALMIHGRPDLAEIGTLMASPSLSGWHFQRHESPSLDEGDAALGLTSIPNPGVESFNLIRSLVGRAKFLEIFPWGQAILLVGLLVTASAFLQHRLANHRSAEAAIRTEDSKYGWAKTLPIETLRAEKKDLEERIESTRSFLATRILWTSYARALAGRLTPELSLVSIQGIFEIDSPGSKFRPKRSLVIRLNTPIPRTGTMPPEIDAFLRNLREAPLLKKDFPGVDLADLRWTQNSSQAANATFSVVCLPVKTAPPKPQAEAAAKSKDH